MLPKENKYTENGQKQKYVFGEIMEEFQLTYEGKNVEIEKLVQDADGEYSEENLMLFLDQLIAMCPKWKKDLSPKEADYLKTLLYLGIRAKMAHVNHVMVPEDYYIGYITRDYSTSFFSLSKEMTTYNLCLYIPRDYDEFANHFKYKALSPISDDLAATIASVYYYLTGKEVIMSSPYPDIDSLAIAQHGSMDKAWEVYAKEEEQWDDEWLEYTSSPEYEEEQALYNPANLEPVDPEIVKDMLSYIPTRYVTEEEIEEENNRKYFPPRFDKESKIYKEEKRRLQIQFSNKKEYIKMFEHYQEIVGPEFAELEEWIPIMFDRYQKNYDLTIYTRPELYASVYDHIYQALELIKKENP